MVGRAFSLGVGLYSFVAMAVVMKNVSGLLADLNKISFFDEFSALEKKYICEKGLFGEYQSGETIIREGESDRTFFVVIEGQIKITKNSHPDQVIAELGPGAVFGEIAHFARQVRSTNVIAAAVVSVFKLEHDRFKGLDSNIKVKINHQTMAILMRRLEDMQKGKQR